MSDNIKKPNSKINIMLKKSDSMFVYYTLRQFARTNPHYNDGDKEEVLNLAHKFHVK